MKKLLTIVFLLAMSTTIPLWAQHVSPLKQKAKSLLERKLNRALSLDQIKEASLSAADASLKAFNIEGGGFALLRYDGTEPTVIGYSDQGRFAEEGMPEPMREWMEAVSSPTSNSTGRAPFVYTYTPVEPLLRTQWGQREPFNGQCPTYNDEPTPAGCTAVALAQVLYYYQSENTSSVVEEYVNKATNTEITVDYSKGRYDWDNMLPSYEDGAYTSQQADAVARLMFEAGVACHCQYAQYLTSGSVPFVALQRHYNFNCNFYYRPYVTTEMWMDVIQRNLMEGNPLVYSGGSHCYIVDGIDADGLCHVNWGWAGLDDGYYDIALSNPPSSYSSYVSGQQIITDISPRKTSEQYQEQVVQAGTIVGYDYSAVTSNSYDSRSCEFGVGYVPVGNDVTLETLGLVAWHDPYSLAYPTIRIKGSNGAVIRDGADKTTLSDGVYRQCLVYGDKDDRSSWHIAYWPEEFMSTIEVHDGRFVADHRRDSVYIHQLQTVSDACNGSYFYLMLECELDKNIRGNKVYASYISDLTFENLETGKKYVEKDAHFSPFYYPGVKYQVVYRVKPTNEDNGFTMPAGTYRFAFGEPNSDWANATDHDYLITIAPKPDYPLLDVNQDEGRALQKDVYYDYDIPIFFPRNLYSANNVGGKVVMNIYAKREGEDEEFFVCSIPDYEVNANSESTLKYEYTLPVKLFPLWGAYKFSFRYLTPDGERTLLNPLAMGQRVIIWQTNDYFPYLQASSQLSHSPSANQPPSSAARHSSSENSMSMQVSNRGSRKFEGSVTATFINTSTGDFVKAESEPVVIASGQETEVMFRVSLPTEGTYDVYFDGVEQGRTVGTALLRDDLQQRAHQTVTVGASGIKETSISSKKGSGFVYDLAGRKVLSTLPHSYTSSFLKKGVYIVNGKKIVID